MSRLVLALTLAGSLLGSLAHAERVTSVHAVFVDDTAQAGGPAALDRASVHDALARRRAESLAAFHAYQTTGVFPSNIYKAGELNVWRDQDGHLCAAATVIKASGQTKLVDQVARDSNFIKLGDVTSGPLMDWILTSGLTQDEVALIQRPYRPVVQVPIEVPVQHVAVDARLKHEETARLAKTYREIERTLRQHTRQSLELAVDKLMQQPRLAATILG